MNFSESNARRGNTFPALFAKTTESFPTAHALALRGKFMSYAELDSVSDSLAWQLAAMGVRRDTLVALCLPRTFEMIIGMLAIMKAGGAYVPIDPNYPPQRIDYILEDSRVEIVLSSSTVKPTGSGKQQKWICLDKLQLSQSSAGNGKFSLSSVGNDLAYVIYTSGSTGAPKGVMIEQASVVNLLLGLLERVGIDSHMRWLGIAPIVFDASVGDWMACLASGGCYVIPDEDQTDNPHLLAELVDTVQVVVATPSRWKQIINTGWKGNPDLTIMCGGEPLTKTLLEDLTPRCKALWNCYGPTEATVWSLVRRVHSTAPGEDQLYIGGTLPNYRHLVLNDQNRPLPEGEVGELCIAGTGLARAYLNKYDLTKQKFIHLDLNEHTTLRIYKTGDLVKQVGPDEYVFVGREDNQIKIRGYRVELGEIESRLRNLRDARDAVVVYTSLDSSDEEGVLVAYLEMPELDIDGSSTEEHLLAALEEKHKREIARELPDYMVPAIFVYLEAFPLTPNGKVDRKTLPHPMNLMRKRRIVEPGTATQKKLAQIWAHLFPGRQFGITDSFFSLGGSSLLAVNLVNEIRERFNFSFFTLQDVREFPSIEKQAELVEFSSLCRSHSQPSGTNNSEREVITL